jgi:Ca-activated chloride channel family protein
MSPFAFLADLRLEWLNVVVAAATALVALPLILYFQLHRGRPPRVRFSSLRNAGAATPSLKVRLRHLPLWLRLGVLAVFLVAFTHPYLEREKPQPPEELGQEEQEQEQEEERKKIEVPTQGISIQLLVDRSGSMGTFPKQDMFGRQQRGRTNYVRFEGELLSKLDVVKIISQRFVTGTRATQEQQGDSIFSGRASDMIALMTFARYPYQACPLTLRHELLLDYISQAEVVTRREEDGTYIGYALERAVLQVVETKSRAQKDNAYAIKSSIIVLITDGEQAVRPEDQEDEHKAQSPLQAAGLAKEHEIKVYTIGIMPKVIYDDNGTAYDTRRMRGGRFDTSELEKVAAATGGRFFRAEDGAALQQIYAEIDRLEKSEIPAKKELEVRVEKSRDKRKIETEVVQLFPLLLWLGFAALLFELLLRELYFRRIP